MKKELKEITDMTICEVLQDEIILPSVYFEKFNKNARTLELDLEHEGFEDNINKLIVEEFNTIEEYMSNIEKNIANLSELTKDSKEAIKNKDYISLNESYKKIQVLENEIKELTNKIYKDNSTNSYNKKWFFNKYLDENSNFKDDCIAIDLTIKDFELIKSEYGKLIADNLTIFIINFLHNNFLEAKEHLGETLDKYHMVRYYDEKFIIFVENETKEKVDNLLFNIRQLLTSTTLKSNSGLLIKANFDYSLMNIKKAQSSKIIIDNLAT